MMKTPTITKLNIPKLIDSAALLPTVGKLLLSYNNLLYLDVDDKYIHELFPLLQNPTVEKPDYFYTNGVGAHITVIYPEENRQIDKKYLEKEYHFTIDDIVIAEIGQKKYYVLLVHAPSLLKIRKKCGLPEMLNFKNYSIGFHITIGVEANI